MRTITALRGIVDHKNQTGACRPATTDPACNLDITCRSFWLTNYPHKRESININADFNHIRSEARIDYVSTGRVDISLGQAIHHFHNLSLCKTARQFFNYPQGSAIVVCKAFAIKHEL